MENLPRVGIMSDPRVFRGSVAARQREKALEENILRQKQKMEQQFKTEQIRNRLSMIINTNQSQPNMMSGLKRHPLARLAGPIGKKAWDYDKLQEYSKPLIKDNDRSLTSQKLVNTKLGFNKSTLPAIGNNSKATKNVDTEDFKNVSFVPIHQLHGRDAKVSTLPYIDSRAQLTQVVPTIGTKLQKSKPRQNVLPYRIQKSVHNSFVQNPPPTAVGLPSLANVSVQTEEKHLFEETFNPLVSEIVESAIADAYKGLLEEDKKHEMLKKNQELQKAIQLQMEHIQELNLVVEKQTKDQMAIEKEKQEAIEQYDLLESKKLANELMEEVLNKTMTNQKLGFEQQEIRSIATDTRNLNKLIEEKEMAINRNLFINPFIFLEVKSEFFPFVYANAEKEYVHKLADSYLIDALFSNNPKMRDQSKNQLYYEIDKYNKIKPTQQTNFNLLLSPKLSKFHDEQTNTINSCRLSIDPLVIEFCSNKK